MVPWKTARGNGTLNIFVDKVKKMSETESVQTTHAASPGLNLALWREAVAGMRKEAGRVADRILPLMQDIRRMRDEGTTMRMVWEAARQTGLTCCYTSFLRAVRQHEENTLTPLAAARRRRRQKAMPPSVPVALKAAPAGKGAALAVGTMMQADTASLGAGLTAFQRKDTPPSKAGR